MKACVLSLLIFICFTELAESRSTVDETVKELLKELKLLESIKHSEAKTNQVKVPPGAHEVPGDENDDGDAITTDIPFENDDNNWENSDNKKVDDDDDDNNELKLPPGAHEVSLEYNVTNSCKPGEDCKKPDNNSKVDVNERILLYLAESKAKSAFKGKSNIKATQNLVLSKNNLACGASKPYIFTKKTGFILSPDFANNFYYNGLTCSWQIIAPVGKVVKVSIQFLDLKNSDNCTYDSLQIWDVIGSKALLIGKFCGRVMPQELLKSSGQIMFVDFVTHGNVSNGRFSIKWELLDPNPPKPHDLTCGRPAIEPNVNQKIVHGKPAEPYSWPWQISLRLLHENECCHHCGGSIVNKNVIITAAHCFFDENHRPYDKSDFLVVAGDYNQSTSSDGPIQRSYIKFLYVHESYNPMDVENDIAAIVLKTPLTFNDHISPVCLPTENPSLYSLCYATGWGDTKGTGDKNILNQVRLPIVPQTICAQDDYHGADIIDSKLCAGFKRGGESLCHGDSGGPFVCYNQLNNRWYLHGITSYGMEDCGMLEGPVVFTRTNSYLCWISQTTGVNA